MRHRIFILLVFLLLLSIVIGCKKAAEEKKSLVQTMTISEDCATQEGMQDSCCHQQCTDYCKERGYVYFKHDINGNTCLCWCD